MNCKVEQEKKVCTDKDSADFSSGPQTGTNEQEWPHQLWLLQFPDIVALAHPHA